MPLMKNRMKKSEKVIVIPERRKEETPFVEVAKKDKWKDLVWAIPLILGVVQLYVTVQLAPLYEIARASKAVDASQDVRLDAIETDRASLKPEFFKLQQKVDSIDENVKTLLNLQLNK